MDADINPSDVARPPATMVTTTSRLTLANISVDGGTQARDHLHQDVIDDYAVALEAGATFPPVVVYYDGDRYWLADGFHRFHACRKLGREHIDAAIRQGSRRDAVLHSVGANEEHGLRRTNDDKRRAVQTLLGDAEWSQWPDAEIARVARVNRKLVNRLRNSGHLSPGTSETASRKYINKHGNEATMNVARIGNAERPARTVTRTVDAEFRADPDVEADADAAAHDLAEERAERIALTGAAEIEAENERLKKQIAGLDRRIATLTNDNASLQKRVELWRQRALDAGWTKANAHA